jgi:cytochrome c oxidase assembly protein subunit 15
MGIGIREEVDSLFKTGISRDVMGSELLDVNLFLVHRTFSWVLLISAAALAWFSKFKKVPLLVFVFVALEAIAGIILGNFGFKAWAQPIHLTLACLLIGAEYLIVLKSRHSNTNVS